jgi:IgGFc binding protein
MIYLRNVSGALGAVFVGGASLVVAVACGRDRAPLESQKYFAEAEGGGPQCFAQCSIDGRSSIEVCDGKVVNTVACAAELACGGGVCQEPCTAAKADRSSNGCEFYIHPPRYQHQYKNSCYAAFVVNTSNQDANVVLEHEGKPLDISHAVFRTTPGSAELVAHSGPLAPGEGAILFVSDRDRTGEPPVVPTLGDPDIPCPDGVVPASHADVVSDGTGMGVSFHVTSNVPVSLASIFPFSGAGSFLPTATLHLPVSAWANEHILVNGWERGPWGSPGALIVASEDDTEVTLVPKVPLQNGANVVGVPAGTPAKFRLGKGQNLQLVQAEELTGSIVTSNKPVSTYGGHGCATIPSDVDACDIITQQIPAVEQWGSEYVGVGYRPRLGNDHEAVRYRIVAAQDGTRLDYDPPEPPAGAPVTLSAGESKIFVSGTSDAFVVRTQDSDHPIYLAAYMGGGSEQAGTGDPEFMNIVPAKQYLNSYAFYADPTYRETSLVIVRAKSEDVFHDVWLDCAGTLTDFRPIGTRGEYEFRRVDLSRKGQQGESFDGGACKVGMQRMRSDGPFSAAVWGWGSYTSYAFAGGMALRKLATSTIVTH